MRLIVRILQLRCRTWWWGAGACRRCRTRPASSLSSGSRWRHHRWPLASRCSKLPLPHRSVNTAQLFNAGLRMVHDNLMPLHQDPFFIDRSKAMHLIPLFLHHRRWSRRQWTSCTRGTTARLRAFSRSTRKGSQATKTCGWPLQAAEGSAADHRSFSNLSAQRRPTTARSVVSIGE